MFKGSNKILKMVSIALVGIIIIGCLIWLIIDISNYNAIYSELSTYDSSLKAEGLMQNQCLLVISSMLGLLVVALLICWIRSLLSKSESVLRFLIVLLSILAMCTLLVWLFSGISDIIDASNELRENVLDKFNALPEWVKNIDPSCAISSSEALKEISNNEVEQIVVHVLTVLICSFGVLISAVVIYYLADGFGRIVRSLEVLANKTQQEQVSEMCFETNESSIKADAGVCNTLDE